MVVGYIAGAEVLWRMTEAQINWEFGKYAASAIMLIALFRAGRLRPPVLAILFFVLLLPSAALTMSKETFAVARDYLSFNLSGPLALTVCAWFFSQVRLDATQLRKVFIAVVGPALGIATLAAVGTFAGSDVVFFDSSNFASSGGFGPNQVSGVLGLGALVALFLSFASDTSPLERLVMVAALIALATQSALTFSRGGLYMAGGGTAVAACFAAKDARLRARLLPLVAALFIVGNYFIVPYLDAFTNGAIAVRFQDTNLTGRDQLVQADIELWKENMLLGVGPGEGKIERGNFFVNGSNGVTSAVPTRGIAAHTEFSRLLSEHGSFGFAALLIFLLAGFRNVWQAPDPRSRALTAGLIAWSALFMLSCAMRILAPSFAFGLAFMPFAVQTVTETPGGPQPTKRGRHARPLVQGHPSLAKVPQPQTIG
jgi:O-antigen ligase